MIKRFFILCLVVDVILAVVNIARYKRSHLNLKAYIGNDFIGYIPVLYQAVFIVLLLIVFLFAWINGPEYIKDAVEFMKEGWNHD